MKLWISLALLVALAVACVTVPLGNRTVWGHAKNHGVPQATGRALATGGRAAASGMQSAWTWMTARPEADKSAPVPPPKRAARREDQKPARQTYNSARFRAGAGEPAAGAQPGPGTQPGLGAQAGAGAQGGPSAQAGPNAQVAPNALPADAPEASSLHGILEAPPHEKISESDKGALDRLVAGAPKKK